MKHIKVQYETDSHCPYCNNVNFLTYGGKPAEMIRCMGCWKDYELSDDKTEWVEVDFRKNKVDGFEDIIKR